MQSHPTDSSDATILASLVKKTAAFQMQALELLDAAVNEERLNDPAAVKLVEEARQNQRLIALIRREANISRTVTATEERLNRMAGTTV